MTEERNALVARIQDQGALVAFETALAVCRDPKAPAAARAAAAGHLFRAAEIGGFGRRGDPAGPKDIAEMSLAELQEMEAHTRAALRELERPKIELQANRGADDEDVAADLFG